MLSLCFWTDYCCCCCSHCMCFWTNNITMNDLKTKQKLYFNFFFKFGFWIYPKLSKPEVKFPNPTRNEKIPVQVIYPYIKIPENPIYPIQTRTGFRTPLLVMLETWGDWCQIDCKVVRFVSDRSKGVFVGTLLIMIVRI